MRIVGLTGGIASGKSTASKEFQALGVPIIDADKVAHVEFPNTQGGVLSYHAKVMATSSIIDDLALICPVDEDLPFPKNFQSLSTLQRWLPYKPQVNDRVLLLSFPSCKGENWFSNSPTGKDDLPWFAKGRVSCFHAKNAHGSASYISFEGASRALLLLLDKDGRAIPMIHLGTYHESQEIPVWNAKALPLLNESLFQKGCNGYFTINAGAFLEEYFAPPPDPITQNLHPQVARAKVKALSLQVACVEGKEDMEILDDIFSPWPGLDDNLEDEN